MGNWTLGRLGLDVVMDSANGPDRWDITGDRVKFNADIRATNLTDAKFARFQAIGLGINPDEEFVPFTWTEDAVEWDGFYRVESVKVGTVKSSLNANWFPAEFEITRLADNANAPMAESRLLGGARTNTHAITNGVAVAWWATPGDAYQDRVAGTTTQARTTAEGTVRVQYAAATTTNLTDGAPTFFCAPGDWYDSAAKVQLSGDGGTTYRAMVGLQTFNLPTSWRLDNGLVRVYSGGADGVIYVQHYVSGAWVTAKRYQFTIGSPSFTTATAVGAFRALTILRNAPEEVRIRLTVEHSSSVEAALNIDLGLRRGALWVDGLVSRAPEALSSSEVASTSYALGVQRYTAEQGISHTSGIHASASDGNGKYILTTTSLNDVHYTNGNITGPLSATTFPFMIGYEATGATTNDNFTNQVYGWFAACEESCRVVQR